MRRTGNPISCLSNEDIAQEKVRVEGRLARAWALYEDAVWHIAADAQRRVLNPFLDANPGLRFSAGMGSWSLGLQGEKDIAGSSIYHIITGRHGDDIEDKRYEALFEILNMGVDGMEYNDLGSLMVDYPPKGTND